MEKLLIPALLLGSFFVANSRKKTTTSEVGAIDKSKIKYRIITKEDWKKTPKDYKSIIDGIKFKMFLTENGTALIPVKIVN